MSYRVCTCCGFTWVPRQSLERCASCDADEDHVRDYATLAEADADVGHLFKRPSAESRGPTASDLSARARHARL